MKEFWKRFGKVIARIVVKVIIEVFADKEVGGKENINKHKRRRKLSNDEIV